MTRLFLLITEQPKTQVADSPLVPWKILLKNVRCWQAFRF